MSKQKVLLNNIIIYETIINNIEKEFIEASRGIYKKSKFYRIKNKILKNIRMYKKSLKLTKDYIIKFT